MVQEGDGEVEVAHLRLVGKGVGAGEGEDAFLGAEAELGAEGGELGIGGREGAVEAKVDAGEEQVRGNAGRGELGELVDDVGDAVGDAEKGVAAERVGQARVEAGGGLGGGGGAEGAERLAGVGFEQEVFVVLEVDEQAGAGRRGREVTAAVELGVQAWMISAVLPLGNRWGRARTSS